MGLWLGQLNRNPLDWLLHSNPWTKYRTLTDLLDYPPESGEATSAKREVAQNPLVRGLIQEASDWMPRAASRNNDPQLSYFKLRMLSDFGLDCRDQDISPILETAAKHTSEGFFACRGQTPGRTPKGEKFIKPDPYADTWHVSPCNSPMITYSLAALGFTSTGIDGSIAALQKSWEKEPGWFCNYFFVNSQFKKVKAGCPMAALMALEVFSLFPDLKESSYARNAFAPLEFHKEYGQTLYYFGRSRKFWTFKYPFVWYNALYLADVLSRFEFARPSSLLQECLDWIVKSQDAEGRFTPTSIFMPYKHWDFGNKKEASPWISFLCCRILKRVYP